MARYECPICGEKFNTTAAIKFHIETKHEKEFREMPTENGKPVGIRVNCFIYAPYER